MNNGKILLTSTGLTAKNVARRLLAIVKNPGSDRVAIITTAAEGKSENKYSQLAKKQFGEMGFAKVDFIDLEAEPQQDLSRYNIFYVCGGNTFKLLKFARQTDFKSSIENLLKKGGIYIGVSAGSIIVCPSIAIAEEVAHDDNNIGLEDLTGLELVDFIILPHYSPEIEDEVIAFENRHRIKTTRISNSQAILVEDQEKTLIE